MDFSEAYILIKQVTVLHTPSVHDMYHSPFFDKGKNLNPFQHYHGTYTYMAN